MIDLKIRMVSGMYANIDVELDNGVKFEAGLHDKAELLHLAREFKYWATELQEYAECIKEVEG